MTGGWLIAGLMLFPLFLANGPFVDDDRRDITRNLNYLVAGL